jgi:hypothetical protein
MTKPIKKNTSEFTTHTLWTWTAPAQKSVQSKVTLEVTQALQEQFENSLKESQKAIEKKLEEFEDIPLSRAAANSLIR